ncbi:ABC transporter permease [Streptomyces sp. YIM 98790]|uniref:ABC transporter permease n=1 Tax=Streptomyces sp. YIM 98790 TaxID=2689077 RepID=UPI00140B13D8|nr:ABC transporter permease [Streptomyces sp. YIM 98790]
MTPRPARMAPADVLRTGASGLHARPLRVVLSALGIAIGIAAMVCVTGISASSREDLNRQLAELGTNLLTVSPGQTLGGEESPLPAEAPRMIDRIGPVETVSATGKTQARVYRTDLVPKARNNSIAVRAAALGLPAVTGAEVAAGAWLNDATAAYPAVVLGSKAAERLGVHRAGADVLVWLGDRWFTVTGILHPAPLAPELDTSALVGWPVAEAGLGFDGYPTTVYARTAEDAVEDVQSVLGATANPAAPNEVQVSRPSEALAAKQAADATLNALLLGLGAVSLLVGGVGVANTMVISVLERRAEIGLRRSLGATRGQIRTQFLVESQLLSALGGAGGVLLGIAVTAGYAASQGWPSVVPAWAMGGGLAATLLIGACAGLYPALRAARLAPTEALAAA